MTTTPCAAVPLVDFLDDLEDPRVERVRLHSLHDILVTTILAVICGADSWTDVELFGRSKHAWLATFLALPHGIPSHDPYGRVFALLAPEALERGFSRWVQSLASLLPGEVVAIDGKTARRSHDRWLGVPALHVVSAWAAEAQLVLGQRKTDTKSNEITAIPQLLALLELKGCIVTIDALGCQTAIAADLRARGADYVLSLKQNQPHLHAAVVEMFAHERSETFDGCPHTFTETVGKGHGRIETRRCWAIDAPDYRCHVDPDQSWPGLRSLVMVEAQRRLEGRTTTETRYFISSRPAQDTRLPRAVRRHWRVPSGCENSLHWVLDIAFREDESRIRTGHAAHNMALLRRLALNLLRRDRQARGGLAARRKRAGWDHRYLQELLTQ